MLVKLTTSIEKLGKNYNTNHHVDIIVVLVRGRVDDPLVVPRHGDVRPGCHRQFHIIHTCYFLSTKFQK
jgi:hypothetical protein